MFDIWTRDTRTPNKLDYMMGGFSTAHDAMFWLINTYLPDAEFWTIIKEIKIIKS